MRKTAVELNGLSNAHMRLNELHEMFGYSMVGPETASEFIAKAKEDLTMFERYILACQDATNEGRKLPFWHDVLASPKSFPTMKERIAKSSRG